MAEADRLEGRFLVQADAMADTLNAIISDSVLRKVHPLDVHKRGKLLKSDFQPIIFKLALAQ